MVRVLTNLLTLAWLTGPIFSKELRVGSRRKRSYLLRVAYIALLLGFVAIFWLRSVRENSSSSYDVSRMAELGKIVSAIVVAVQFFALQLFAVVMCSTAISEERYRRTLGVLMTTPITSLQIVMGKLLSRTLQLFLLLALSLPVLAVVRVFGGVQWQFLLQGLAVTATAMIFAGSVSLFYSIFTRHAYAAVLLTLLTGAVFYLLPPYLAYVSFVGHHRPWWTNFVAYSNPFAAWSGISLMLFWPGAGGAGLNSYILTHCLIMLGASLAVLLLAVWRVRRIAIRQIVGGPGRAERLILASPRVAAAALLEMAPAGPVITDALDPEATAPLSVRPSRQEFRPGRSVGNWPVLWRELRQKLIASLAARIIIFSLGILLLFTIYPSAARGWDSESFHQCMCTIWLILGLLTTAVVAATTCTVEKEAGSWEILLASPLPGRQIVVHKMLGAMWRCWPAWLPLAGHLIGFSLLHLDRKWMGTAWVTRPCIDPPAAAMVGVTALASAVFVAGLGTLFSVNFRKTTAAVVASLGTGLFVWLIMPLVVALTVDSKSPATPEYLVISANPAVQIVVLLDEMSGQRDRDWDYDVTPSGTFSWPDQNCDFEQTLNRWRWFNGIYMAVGGLAVVWAARSCRRRRI